MTCKIPVLVLNDPNLLPLTENSVSFIQVWGDAETQESQIWVFDIKGIKG